MIYNCIVLLIPVIAAILEMLPYGAVLVFAPFITAILTCVLIFVIAVMLFKKSAKIKKYAFRLSAAAAVVSLLPAVMFGLEYYSIVEFV